jgi:hypothetical protein
LIVRTQTICLSPGQATAAKRDGSTSIPPWISTGTRNPGFVLLEEAKNRIFCFLEPVTEWLNDRHVEADNGRKEQKGSEVDSSGQSQLRAVPSDVAREAWTPTTSAHQSSSVAAEQARRTEISHLP